MELLEKLYETFSPSNGEKKMVRFIKSWVAENVPDAICRKENKNLYITRGKSATYPCMVAHLDQVQDEHSKDFKVHRDGDIIFGFSESSKQQQGLGADDKNGIWVALKCLQKYADFKCAFFVGEEIGCVGSSKADMKFFDDCRFVLECDRRGNGDFITSIGCTELCSTEFVIDANIAEFGYSENIGMMTDVEELKSKGLDVSCVNMSCGYYNPHTDHETTSWSDLNRCKSLCEYIIEHCVNAYPHDSATAYGRYKFYNSSSYWNFGTKDYTNRQSEQNDPFYDSEKLKGTELFDEIYNYLWQEVGDYGYLPKLDDLQFWYREMADADEVERQYNNVLLTGDFDDCFPDYEDVCADDAGSDISKH